MKFINKTLALLLACSAVGLVQAGNIEWRVDNTTQSFHTYELQAAIREGIESAGSLPDLPNPWFLQFSLSSGASNDYKAEPGLILIQKIRWTPAGKAEEACKRMNFGTFTKTSFIETLRNEAKYAAGYATTDPGCIVNDPVPVAPPAAPAKKSSKK